MSNLEHTTSWQQIQQGVKGAERLIVNKNYNLVMVKARQTLECMVRCMAEKACLVEGDLSDTIDQLYEGGWINKTTKDNYHTIRILGNKAVHENDNTAYNANQAYQLLTQEVHAFSHDGGASGGGRTQRISSGGGRERRSEERRVGKECRGEARGLHLLETVREAVGLSRGREPRPDVPVTAPDSEIQMSDGENAGEYHRCFICGVF